MVNDINEPYIAHDRIIENFTTSALFWGYAYSISGAIG